jgi:hypothetical protein
MYNKWASLAMSPVEITAMETVKNFRLNQQIKQDRKHACL